MMKLTFGESGSPRLSESTSSFPSRGLEVVGVRYEQDLHGTREARVGLVDVLLSLEQPSPGSCRFSPVRRWAK